MPNIDSFHYFIGDYELNQDQVFEQILASGAELVVVETGNTSKATGNTLTQTELQTLENQGHTIIGYVNVAVPDHNRNFWSPDQNAPWVIPDINDLDDLDYGTLTANAPDWLTGNFGRAEGPEPGGDGIFGYIVDFRDEAWQQIVVDQAVELVSYGYDGVFLDDVVQYYAAANTQGSGITQSEAAITMMQLVNRVAHEVQLINPQAYIGINGGAYLRWDADALTGDTPEWREFLRNVDGLLMENQFTENNGQAWIDANIHYENSTNPQGIDFLAIETASLLSPAQITAFEIFANENNLLSFIATDSAYNTPPISGTLVPDPPPSPVVTGTAMDDFLLGTTGNDTVTGAEGSDTIYCGLGNDALLSGTGYDVAHGGAGNDTMDGGIGNDTLYGGYDHDVLVGGRQEDFLYGEDGDDTLYGNAGFDRLEGGAGDDFLDSSFKCNTQSPQGIGCCDGQTK
jgi:endo-alpha-1,4-polygalactosaminidase (GH114 family)